MFLIVLNFYSSIYKSIARNIDSINCYYNYSFNRSIFYKSRIYVKIVEEQVQCVSCQYVDAKRRGEVSKLYKWISRSVRT